MPWSRPPGKHYQRDRRRDESDVTDAAWAIVDPMRPKPGRLGRPRQTDLREVFHAIESGVATGCQGRARPRDVPPDSTVITSFEGGQARGVVDPLMEALGDRARAEAQGRADSGHARPPECEDDRLAPAVMTVASRVWAASARSRWTSTVRRWGWRSTRHRDRTATVRRL